MHRFRLLRVKDVDAYCTETYKYLGSIPSVFWTPLFSQEKSHLNNGLDRLSWFQPRFRSILFREERCHAVEAQGHDVPVVFSGGYRTVHAAALCELRQRQPLVEYGRAEGQLDVPAAGLLGQVDDGTSYNLGIVGCMVFDCRFR